MSGSVSGVDNTLGVTSEAVGDAGSPGVGSGEEGPGEGSSRLRLVSIVERNSSLARRSSRMARAIIRPTSGSRFGPTTKRDHKDEEDLLKASAELKHNVTLRGLTSPLEPRHDPGPVVVER